MRLACFMVKDTLSKTAQKICQVETFKTPGKRRSRGGEER